MAPGIKSVTARDADPAPPTGGPGQPPEAAPDHLLFQRLRWRLVVNTARQVAREAPARVLTVLLCSLIIWGIVFAVSYGGFRFLSVERKIPLGGGLVGTLFDLLFLTLTVLLTFSTGIILYSSLFTSAEATYLLHGPAPVDHIYAYKYQGAVAFSSWAFLLLGSPVLVGYGLVEQVGWPFYVLMPIFFLGFVLIPGSLGALACLLIVNFIPRQRKQVLVLAVLASVAAASYLIYQSLPEPSGQDWDRDLLNGLLGRLHFSQGPIVPSHWMTRGLQYAARGDLKQSLTYLALVWSNGLLLYLGMALLSVGLYRRGYNRVHTGGSLRRRYGGAWMDAALSGLLAFLHPQVRLLVVKDLRTFRRDPAQWAQVLIFAGLMTLYFSNIRKLYLGDIGWRYQNGISLLNLLAIGLLLSAYTGRFIYPMLSLEGRKFWVLGLLPMRRERLLWGKFAFATTGGLILAEGLVVLSDVMLKVPAIGVVLHAVAVAVLAAGLSGLSVGLGACMPNFREVDPSKIAVGFGGTMNLVAGLLFVVLTVGLIAVPWHMEASAATDAAHAVQENLTPIIAQAVAGVLVGAAAVVLPLWAGARTLRAMEF
jgi:ABC-2 type transport system permease protein